MRKSINGFTIVELIIVIVVIGILATITVVAYNGVQQRAKVASVGDGLVKVRDAMLLWVSDEQRGTWPVDPVDNGGTPLSDMMTVYPVFGRYLNNVPSVDGVQTQEWFYDNDGDAKPNCGGDAYAGVNIVLRFVTDQKIAQGVDDSLDDGNLNCGKVRYVDQRIFYALSNDQLVH